jgi:hypothetical protein
MILHNNEFLTFSLNQLHPCFFKSSRHIKKSMLNSKKNSNLILIIYQLFDLLLVLFLIHNQIFSHFHFLL